MAAPLCRYFALGRCRNGDACMYVHALPATAAAAAELDPRAGVNPRAVGLDVGGVLCRKGVASGACARARGGCWMRSMLY